MIPCAEITAVGRIGEKRLKYGCSCTTILPFETTGGKVFWMLCRRPWIALNMLGLEYPQLLTWIIISRVVSSGVSVDAKGGMIFWRG